MPLWILAPSGPPGIQPQSGWQTHLTSTLTWATPPKRQLGMVTEAVAWARAWAKAMPCPEAWAWAAADASAWPARAQPAGVPETEARA